MNHIRNYILDINTKQNTFITLAHTKNNNVYDLIDLSANASVNMFLQSQLINLNNRGARCNNHVHLLHKVHERLTTLMHVPYDNYFIIKQHGDLNTHSLKLKAYTVFPNVNFELKQIKNLSFSNTALNKVLISKHQSSTLQSGFFTMSKNHHLVALQNDITYDNTNTNANANADTNVNAAQTLKQIIFGVWINLKHEKPSPRKIDLDNLIDKYKMLIYMKCFEFIQLSHKFDTIYSPSPDQSVFILVLFYHGMQCHYEVRLFPNEEEDNVVIHPNTTNNICNELFHYGNNWLMKSNEIELDIEETNTDVNVDVKSSKWDKVYPVKEFIIKKSGGKASTASTQGSFLHNIYTNNKAVNTNNTTNDKLFDDSKMSLLGESCDNDNEYDYPLVMHEKKKEEGCVLSRASTNTHSNKISSYSTSKNSCNKNYIGVNSSDNDDVFKETKEIMVKQAESIKQLEDKINQLEIGIKNVLNKLISGNDDNNVDDDNNNNNDITVKNNISGSNNRKYSEEQATIFSALEVSKDKSLSIPRIIVPNISNYDE